MDKALIIEDIQNDFMPGGTYPVPHGNEVIAPINKLIDHARTNNWLLVFSRDWHPEGMNHCVQHTKGSQFCPDLHITESDIVISKGKNTGAEHYSTFNGDNRSLLEILQKNHIHSVYIAGLATDYCVLHTALDSQRYGFHTTVILDACRAINKDGISEGNAIRTMEEKHIEPIQVSDVI